MTSNFNKYKVVLIFVLCSFSFLSFSQEETSTWKMQIGFGFNNPIDNIDDDNFFSKYLNFPTINLGVQYMFKKEYGAKFDFGFNRSVNGDGSPEYKLNYSRINAQFVYDLTHIMRFLPPQMAVITHIGPGISFTKPLGSYVENTYTFPQAMAGLEIHYGIARTVSVYGDFSYVMSLSNKEKYDPAMDGFSFNGDLIHFTIGVSVSLSGCYYCD
ncbi:MAG: cell envelope biogenesis protein OmpA [Flavobacteriaceae bacterium]|nr:cell envelope biogenesis protein OmpA [Flavobacteriaceae bacterium]